jgi:hypothetical protein
MGDGWQVVRTVGTEEEASLIQGFLESRGVTAQVESLLFHQEPVTFGRMGEVRVRVPAREADEAERLLALLDSSALARAAELGLEALVDASEADADD